jgi:hypothetical protein
VFSDSAASEAERLIREHGYDRFSVAVTTRAVHDKYMASQFRPQRPVNLGQGTEAELSAPGIEEYANAGFVATARGALASTSPMLDLELVSQAELALTGGERDYRSLLLAQAELAEMDPAEIYQLALAQARDIPHHERMALAKRGWALPSGKYPIKHAGRGPGSLHSAAVLAASGHGTPEELAQARGLIKKAAAHFGSNCRYLWIRCCDCLIGAAVRTAW